MLAPSKLITDFVLKVVQTSTSTPFYPVTATAKQLAQAGFGSVSKGQFSLSTKDIRALKDWLSHQGIDWSNASTHQVNRMARAQHSVHEKSGTHAVTKRWLRVSQLVGACRINGTTLQLPLGAHLEIPSDRIKELDVDALLVVENLEPFSQLAIANWQIPFAKVLAVYRGDPSSEKASTYIAQWKQINPHLKIAAFFDFDPAGLEMALALNPSHVVLPEPSHLTDFKGRQQDYLAQEHIAQRLRERLPSAIEPYYSYLQNRRAGFTQERLLVHDIPLQWLHLK